jgi:hypothetical protein
MSVTIAKVRALLDVDEPNYAEAAKLGPQAVPLLETLVREGDAMLASKATYLASLIQSDRSLDVVKAAAESSDPVVRVAAAAALRNLPDAPRDEVLSGLLGDEDPGVRKAALKAAPASVSVPSPSGEKGPAPPESGGGNIGGEGSVSGSEGLSGEVSGEGGGSVDISGEASSSGVGGSGGGSVDISGEASSSGVGGSGGGTV